MMLFENHVIKGKGKDHGYELKIFLIFLKVFE